MAREDDPLDDEDDDELDDELEDEVDDDEQEDEDEEDEEEGVDDASSSPSSTSPIPSIFTDVFRSETVDTATFLPISTKRAELCASSTASASLSIASGAPLSGPRVVDGEEDGEEDTNDEEDEADESSSLLPGSSPNFPLCCRSAGFFRSGTNGAGVATPPFSINSACFARF